MELLLGDLYTRSGRELGILFTAYRVVDGGSVSSLATIPQNDLAIPCRLPFHTRSLCQPNRLMLTVFK